MFEARLQNGQMLKQLVEAIKELVTEGNMDCNEEGITMQAMDASHVSLCTFRLRAESFDHYRCDRAVSLGVNLTNMSKLMKYVTVPLLLL